MISNRIIISAIIFFTLINVHGQVTSQWKDHFSYRNCQTLAESENYIAASAGIGIILYSKENGSVKKYSLVNGLSDIDITAVQSLPDDRFIIGYFNGNIDIMTPNEVINIPDLKNKQIQGGKKINHFHLQGSKAYCSVDFALVVVDINKYEISDTYYLGINSGSLKVYETVTVGNNIYAATESGLFKADLTNPQISYYKGWEEISGTTNTFVAVNYFNKEMITVQVVDSKYRLEYGNEGNWNLLIDIDDFKNLFVTDGSFLISESDHIEKYNVKFAQTEKVENYLFESEIVDNIEVGKAVYSVNDDSYYIADALYGFVIKNGNMDYYFIPNGPYSNNTFNLAANNYGVYSVAGGLTYDYNNLNRNAEYSFFNNEEWSYYRGNKWNWRDLIRICSVDNDNETVYISSWGAGIFEVQGTDTLTHFGKRDDGLQDIFGGEAFIRVGGIDADSEGNIWMSNSEIDGSGIVVKEDTVWHQFSYETTNNLHSTDQILITKDDYVWIIIPRTERQGIMVINPNRTLLDESDDEYRGPLRHGSESDPRNKGQLKIWDENQQEITKTALCLAEDKSGYIWMGTDKGVLVYYRPWSIFSDDYPVASRIKVPRNDGSNLADYLLENEKVSCIAVDGADRKWIGTQGSGVFLVSEDGLKTFQSFNTENSPLPSNYISSIAISPMTGEVFIGTDKGIVSYAGKATEGDDAFNKVYAYPNPVREDFSGDITITGLMQDSNVKITTVNGRLVYETRSLGGKAYWNGRNFSGEKVKTGVYLVFVSTEEGTQSAVTKILIVR